MSALSIIVILFNHYGHLVNNRGGASLRSIAQATFRTVALPSAGHISAASHVSHSSTSVGRSHFRCSSPSTQTNRDHKHFFALRSNLPNIYHEASAVCEFGQCQQGAFTSLCQSRIVDVPSTVNLERRPVTCRDQHWLAAHRLGNRYDRVSYGEPVQWPFIVPCPVPCSCRWIPSSFFAISKSTVKPAAVMVVFAEWASMPFRKLP